MTLLARARKKATVSLRCKSLWIVCLCLALALRPPTHGFPSPPPLQCDRTGPFPLLQEARFHPLRAFAGAAARGLANPGEEGYRQHSARAQVTGLPAAPLPASPWLEGSPRPIPARPPEGSSRNHLVNYLRHTRIDPMVQKQMQCGPRDVL